MFYMTVTLSLKVVLAMVRAFAINNMVVKRVSKNKCRFSFQQGNFCVRSYPISYRYADKILNCV